MTDNHNYQHALNEKSALYRRIKRHVLGPKHIFFAATSPGLERLCAKELNEILASGRNYTIVNGGVEFEGGLQQCYRANLNLHMANRVLMRLITLSATNFKTLLKRIDNFPWELYLFPDQPVTVRVTTKHCRLYHKDAVASRIAAGIEQRIARYIADYEAAEMSARVFTTPQQIFVRGVDDRFTISIDSSGELLYKRGVKRIKAHAPIRETLAAAILELAGDSSDLPLFDPMCGSGTFSLESAMRMQRIPPGFYRGFAFTDWPCFRPRQWRHILLQAEKDKLIGREPRIVASDQNTAVCKAFEKMIRPYPWSAMIRVQHMDFFSSDPQQLYCARQNRGPGLVVINPPYGMRIGSKTQSMQLIEKIFLKLRNDYAGWRIAVIVPNPEKLRHVPRRLKYRPIIHGGLEMTLVTGKM